MSGTLCASLAVCVEITGMIQNMMPTSASVVTAKTPMTARCRVVPTFTSHETTGSSK